MIGSVGRAIVLVVTALVAVPAFAVAQEFYLTGTVVVGGSGDRLSDIAAVAGGGRSQGELHRLLSTPIPRLSDHPALIPARDLRKSLQAVASDTFVIVGGPLIYLPKQVTTAGARAFYTALLREIERSLGNSSARVEVWTDNGQLPDLSGVQPPLSFQFPAGSSSPQALASNSYIEYRGNNHSAPSYLPIHIQVFGLVPVATTTISFGQMVPPASVTYKSEDLANLTGTPATLSGGSYQARSDIQAGSVIYSEMVRKELAVSAGKAIRIAFRKGNVQVSVPGSAFQSGALGDVIQVETRHDNRRLQGRVVSPTEVVVED